MEYERCIWIKRLPPDCTKSQLELFLDSVDCGQFTHCLFRNTNAFVVYATLEDVNLVMEHLKGQCLEEVPLEVQLPPKDLYMKVQGLI